MLVIFLYMEVLLFSNQKVPYKAFKVSKHTSYKNAQHQNQLKCWSTEARLFCLPLLKGICLGQLFQALKRISSKADKLLLLAFKYKLLCGLVVESVNCDPHYNVHYNLPTISNFVTTHTKFTTWSKCIEKLLLSCYKLCHGVREALPLTIHQSPFNS